jgi:hypothetical protein
MKKLFEASEGLGGIIFFFLSGEDFERSLWRFGRVMKEKLWE